MHAFTCSDRHLHAIHDRSIFSVSHLLSWNGCCLLSIAFHPVFWPSRMPFLNMHKKNKLNTRLIKATTLYNDFNDVLQYVGTFCILCIEIRIFFAFKKNGFHICSKSDDRSDHELIWLCSDAGSRFRPRSDSRYVVVPVVIPILVYTYWPSDRVVTDILSQQEVELVCFGLAAAEREEYFTFLLPILNYLLLFCPTWRLKILEKLRFCENIMCQFFFFRQFLPKQ